MAKFESLVFEKTHFKKNFGFSGDFGMSAIKIVYATEEGDNLRFNFISFPNDDHDNAVKFLTKMHAGKLDPGTEVAVCGCGAERLKTKIDEALNISLKIVSEVDTMFSAFKFITSHAPWSDVFHQPSQKALERSSNLAKQFAGSFTALSLEGKLHPWPYMTKVEENEEQVRNYTMPQPVQYPALLTMIGSAMFVAKINEDASVNICNNFSAPAGKTFLGLGSLINNVQGFNTLADMASRGDSSKVDQWANALMDQDITENDMYSAYFQSEHKEFCFGHASDRKRDEFKPEDISAAIVSMIANTAAEDSFTWAAFHKVQQVFFIGGFANSTPYIREQIETEFAYRRFANSTIIPWPAGGSMKDYSLANTISQITYKGYMCDCRFMKHGSHLGAIGALLDNLGVTL